MLHHHLDDVHTALVLRHARRQVQRSPRARYVLHAALQLAGHRHLRLGAGRGRGRRGRGRRGRGRRLAAAQLVLLPVALLAGGAAVPHLLAARTAEQFARGGAAGCADLAGRFRHGHGLWLLLRLWLRLGGRPGLGQRHGRRHGRRRLARLRVGVRDAGRDGQGGGWVGSGQEAVARRGVVPRAQRLPQANRRVGVGHRADGPGGRWDSSASKTALTRQHTRQAALLCSGHPRS